MYLVAVWVSLSVTNVAYALRTLKAVGTECLLCHNILEFPNALCGRCYYYYFLYIIDGETEALDNSLTYTGHRVCPS